MVETATMMDNGEYMEQEEEWEREGLLDPAWEKQQRKVSTPHKFVSTENAETLPRRNECCFRRLIKPGSFLPPSLSP